MINLIRPTCWVDVRVFTYETQALWSLALLLNLYSITFESALHIYVLAYLRMQCNSSRQLITIQQWTIFHKRNHNDNHNDIYSLESYHTTRAYQQTSYSWHPHITISRIPPDYHRTPTVLVLHSSLVRIPHMHPLITPPPPVLTITDS